MAYLSLLAGSFADVVAAFRIEATAKDYGLEGPLGDVSLSDGSPIVVPYAGRLNGSQVFTVNPV